MIKHFFLIVFTISIVAASCNKIHEPYSQAIVMLVGQTVSVDVADTDEKRTKGLSGRLQITETQGMWFEFSQPQMQTFWMKGMNFPIDIVWILEGKVIDITHNAQAEPNTKNEADLVKYKPIAPVDRVLELRAGWANRFGLKRGDSVEFSAVKP